MKKFGSYHGASASRNQPHNHTIQFRVLHMMLERFGDNLTVTTSDISKLTHFPPEYYVSLLLYNPLVVYQKEQLLESLLSD